MKIWLTTDNHFFHRKIVTSKHRPANHEELQLKYWHQYIKDEDYVICLGDFSLGKPTETKELIKQLPGNKVLVLGNHDTHSPQWYIRNGFVWASHGMLYNGIWMSHEPARSLPDEATINIHGHIHDSPPSRHAHIPQPFHRLLAIEHTGYKPVELYKWLVKENANYSKK